MSGLIRPIYVPYVQWIYTVRPLYNKWTNGTSYGPKTNLYMTKGREMNENGRKLDVKWMYN